MASHLERRPPAVAEQTNADGQLLEFDPTTAPDGADVRRQRDGRPQASSPVTGGVDALGRIVISTYPGRAKTVNARRDPRVGVLVLSDDFGDAWVQVDGECEVIDPPDSVEPLVEYFRCISGEHPDWDEYRRAMVEQGKSLLRVTPTRWGPVATGGFPARFADPDA